MKEIKAKEFNFDNIRGISRNQLQQHYQLYLSYIDLRSNILSTLRSETQTTYEYRGLKNGQSYALNGIILHELYFQNMGQTPTGPASRLIKYLERDFGSYNNWLEDFLRCGNAARGWAVLLFNYRDMMFHNIMQDAHNHGAVYEGIPLLVLDVYEHAYMIDFGINKEKYLQIFSKNISWKIVNTRFQHIYNYYIV